MIRYFPLLLALLWNLPFAHGQFETDYQKRRKTLSDRNWEDQDAIYRESYEGDTEVGEAVFYADYLHGQSTALGEIYDKNQMTCAHRTYPKGTLLKVTRLDTRRSVVVRVNDRGSFAPGVVVDLSLAAAELLDLIRPGRATVNVVAVGASYTNPPRPDAAKQEQPDSYYAGANRMTAKGQTQRSIPQAYDATPPPPAKGYAVQLASYRDPGNAERQVYALQQRGISNVSLQEDRRTGELFYKVIIGFFDTRLDAQRYLDQLRINYRLDGFVLGF